jgi:type II secretory pathway component PulF
MPQYSYRALDESGREVAGSLSEGSRSAVLERLESQGLYPVSVEQVSEDVQSGGWTPFGRRVSRSQVDAFTRELANLLGAGVSLSRALSILSREASGEAARRQWAAIHDDVVEGTSLADALARWPRSFAPVYVAMVRAGETGGFLDVVLGQIADLRTRERDLKGRFKSALIYPLVLAVLAGLVLIFLLTYFIPRFSTIFAEMGGSLPVLTRTIVAASEFVTDYGLLLLLFVAVGAVVFKRALASESGRRSLEKGLLEIPMVGRVIARFALVRFCRMLGTLLSAGVPMVAALRVAREAIGNQTLADTVNHATDEVRRGAPLARSLARGTMLFPAAVVEMVTVAEESGNLDAELDRLADTYESELDRRLRTLVALAEPALLFLMAAIVGTIVIGMLLPVFTLQELIQ